MRHLVLLALMTVCGISEAWAHKPSDSYLSLTVHQERIEGQWDIALRDLDEAVGLDHNDDGAISWGEVRAKQHEVSTYAFSRLTLTSSGVVCPARPTEQLIDHHTDGAYAVLRFTAVCPMPIQRLSAEYRLLVDVDALHKGLLRLSYGTTTVAGVFSREAPTQVFALQPPSVWTQVRQYVREGVWHIWLGYDHLLFLLALLLPAVLRRIGDGWEPVPSFRSAVGEVVAIVTAFTLAHSITLSLATLGVVALPSRLVESAIAGSVLLAGLANLYPTVARRRWLVAFGFGLVHGFGFAGVLADLGLPQGSLVLSLLSFNLGVEIGQLAVVSLFLPVAFGLRKSWSYQSFVLRGGSIAVMVLALVWFIERAFDVTLWPA